MNSELAVSHGDTLPIAVVQILQQSLGESVQTGLLVGTVILLLAVSLVAIWTVVDVKRWVPIHLPVRSDESNGSQRDFTEYVDDRERVLHVLERENGQLMQSRIVEETDYSKVKTSRVLADLADNGDVIKVPVGRQNLICLPDNVPEIMNETKPHGRSNALDGEEQPTTEVEESNRSTQTARNDGKP